MNTAEAYSLDANAVIACLKGEDGADVIETLLIRASKGEITLYLSAVNMTEIIYGFEAEKTPAELAAVWEAIRAMPITIIRDISDEVITEAARIKTAYGIPLGDILGYATARVLPAIFVTGDHTDFDPIARDEPGTVWFFR